MTQQKNKRILSELRTKKFCKILVILTKLVLSATPIILFILALFENALFYYAAFISLILVSLFSSISLIDLFSDIQLINSEIKYRKNKEKYYKDSTIDYSAWIKTSKIK